MEHFLVIANEEKDAGLKTAEYIAGYLAAHGKTCKVKAVNRAEAAQISGRDICEGTDCILVLGGDGTLLRAAADTIGKNIPLLGVNMGMLGYLAEVERDNLDQTLERLLEGEFGKERRMMLCGEISRRENRISGHNTGPQEEGPENGDRVRIHALNDIVIARVGSLQIIYLKVYVNGQFLNEYHADGIIFSTPTGSTGYNMSAGGPIVEPGAKLIVLTPICSHTPGARSIVLAAEDEIVVEIAKGKQGQQQEVEASFDGGRRVILHTNDRIIIQKSEQETEIIKMSKVGFLETLHKKMSGT